MVKNWFLLSPSTKRNVGKCDDCEIVVFLYSRTCVCVWFSSAMNEFFYSEWFFSYKGYCLLSPLAGMIGYHCFIDCLASFLSSTNCFSGIFLFYHVCVSLIERACSRARIIVVFVFARFKYSLHGGKRASIMFIAVSLGEGVEERWFFKRVWRTSPCIFLKEMGK